MRFSLRWLFGVVAFVAAGFCCLVNASRPIELLLAGLLYVFLGVSIMGALFARGERRVFWAGCVVTGAVCFASDYLPPLKIYRPWDVVEAIFGYLRLAVWHDKSSRPSHAERAWVSLVAITVTFMGGTIATWFRKNH
ncbi:MAG TPA: hypothetical protein VHC22_28580 [Pirellulales bacterium]|nr:hypothetical protein [Pirellulales bacterium]